jgi:hypothetical protein
MVQELSKKYIEVTQNQYNEIENKIINFLKIIDDKIQNKCQESIKKILSVSVLNEQNNLLTLKPKEGQEKDYSEISKELIQCALPYLNYKISVINHREIFKKMNNMSYNSCIKNCKTNMINEQIKNGEIKFKELKNCLKDCYNLSNFNFRGYSNLMENGIKISTEELEKL